MNDLTTSQIIAIIGFAIVLYLGWTLRGGGGESHHTSHEDREPRPRFRYIIDDDDRPPSSHERHHGDK